MRLLPSLMVIGLVGGGPALAGECDAPLAAALKMNTIPYKLHSVTSAGTDKTLNGGAPEVGDMVATADKLYVNAGGKWHSMDRPKDMGDDTTAAMQAGKVTCTKLREEPVDGVAATVYQVEDKSNEDITGQLVWIADDSGLMLKGEFAMDVGGGDVGKSETTAVFSYDDVAPPADVE